MARAKGFVAACAAVLLVGSFSLADARPAAKKGPAFSPSGGAGPATASAPAPAASQVEVGRRKGRKIFRFRKAWVIPGEIQRPLAVYFLQRSKVRYNWETPKASFTKRIIDAVRGSSF